MFSHLLFSTMIYILVLIFPVEITFFIVNERERFQRNVVSLTRIDLRICIETNIILYDIKKDYIVHNNKFIR